MLFRTALKFFQLKLWLTSFYIVYTLQIGYKAVYKKYMYVIETIKIRTKPTIKSK